MKGESLVLVKEIPSGLLSKHIKKVTAVRNTYLVTDTTIFYKENKDYTIDYTNGTIKRTAHSAIPDFATHPWYGKDIFNHDDYSPSLWSNNAFFVYVDYEETDFSNFVKPNNQSAYLKHTADLLKNGKTLNLVWYGNSIAKAGGATDPSLGFTSLYEKHLKSMFPEASIHSDNVSIPGYGTREALAWFDGIFANLRPDIVFIDFAMNDHNKIGIEPEAFRKNMDSLAHIIKKRYQADIVFFSSMPPNDHWIQSTHRMNQYAEAARQAAFDTKSAYIDVYGLWEKVLSRKQPESLLANNMNHPNDFGHWIYEQAFEAMYF